MHATEPTAALLIRRAEPQDTAALDRMWERCSPRTRYHRFHGVLRDFPENYLQACLTGANGTHEARVAEIVTATPEQARIVGLASTGPVRDEPMIRELGVLVEDAWQRQGIGRALANELFAQAAVAGVPRIRLELCRAQPELMQFLLGHLAVLTASSSGCDVSADVDAMRPIPGRAR